MKVYRVTTERDGVTSREPGRTSTEVLQEHHYYAAETIEQVWQAIDWLRSDPERTVLGVIEVLPALTVLPLRT